MAREPTTGGITVVPANEAPWEDLQTVFGLRGYAAECQCQWFKQSRRDWDAMSREERAFRFRQQTDSGYPESKTTTGLIAYLGEEPVGWCAVEPRTAYPRLRGMRVPWSGRDEDKDDGTIWAVTCFVTRVGHRRRGIAHALTREAVDYARERGARAVEGYAMITHPGEELTWGELYVGSRSMFADAGFREVSHPTKRRVVMRIDFDR
jgi:ribosomal protein S18 acetylase RimI-like enzyme